MRLIELHRCERNGIRLVLDVVRSYLYEADELTDDVLRSAESLPIDEIAAALKGRYPGQKVKEALAELEEMGFFSEADRLEVPGKFDMDTIALHISHRCNLRCKYCYGEDGSYGMEQADMPPDVAEKAVEFLIERSGEGECHIIFFGGEPLLNFDVLGHTVEYADKRAQEQGKRIRYNVVTNGVLLTEKVLDYLDERGIAVQLSIDGDKGTNDCCRPLAGGGSSYDRITEGLEKLLARRGTASARVTVTHKNADALNTVNHLRSLGFSTIHLGPVSSLDPEFALTDEDYARIMEGYTALGEEFLRGGFNILDLGRALRNVSASHRKLYYCGAARRYAAVAPNGDIYPCQRFVGMDDYKLGSVLDGSVNETLVQSFKEAHVHNKKGCTKCWARYLCGGGCYYKSLRYHGDIKAPEGCGLHRHIIETALWVYAEMRKREKAPPPSEEMPYME